MKVFRLNSGSETVGIPYNLTLEFYRDNENTDLTIFAQTPEQAKTGDWHPFDLDVNELTEFIEFLQDALDKIKSSNAKPQP